MLNVSKVLRAALAERFTLARPRIVAEQVSTDGTRKWLIRLEPTQPTTKAPKSSASIFRRLIEARYVSRAKLAAP